MRSPRRGTPIYAERHWLVDAAVRLAVPLVSPTSDLTGVILLGEKRSELPFSPEDRELLIAIAAAN